MSTQATAFHNSRPRSSRKSRLSPPASVALKLAGNLARQVGMVPTWPNVQTIRLAIESEAALSNVSLAVAAAVILEAAKERSYVGLYVCRTSWLDREIDRLNSNDRFWFEDARWRTKFSYAEFQADQRKQRERPEVA